MLGLPADRLCNAVQARILDQAVAEKEVFEAREKARTALMRQLNGESLNEYGYSPDLEDPFGEDEEEGEISPMQRRTLASLPPETLPIEGSPMPFPMLEPPLG